MAQNVNEFLNELSHSEAFEVLSKVFDLQTQLEFRNEITKQKTVATIAFLADQKVYLQVEDKSICQNTDDLFYIKFFLGTEVYFIKTQIKSENELVYFSEAAKVIQLKRRKEPRYNVPTEWNQKLFVWDLETKKKYPSRILDLSLSGMKIEMPCEGLLIEKNKIMRAQLQLFKRGEVVSDFAIRFLLQKEKHYLLGCEFENPSSLFKERISFLVDDLVQFLKLA